MCSSDLTGGGGDRRKKRRITRTQEEEEEEEETERDRKRGNARREPVDIERVKEGMRGTWRGPSTRGEREERAHGEEGREETGCKQNKSGSNYIHIHLDLHVYTYFHRSLLRVRN